VEEVSSDFGIVKIHVEYGWRVAAVKQNSSSLKQKLARSFALCYFPAVMSDVFHQALAQTLPMLEEIRDGIKPPPRASGKALRKLLKEVSSHGASAPQLVEGSADAESSAVWTWDALEQVIKGCEKCPHLVRSRTQVVFGVGNREADLMFVGEAPGADEDEQGEPFIGRAGQLLTKIIEAMEFSREDIFIANVLKCRPDMPEGESGNRKPRPAEMATCLPWLREQIKLVQPKAIVALGATAAEGLLGETRPMRELRGRWLAFGEVPVMVTYHPAYLLRNQAITEKRKVWEDMLLVLKKLNLPISAKQERYFTQPTK
jgi:uracil-DNA glycosylase